MIVVTRCGNDSDQHDRVDCVCNVDCDVAGADQCGANVLVFGSSVGHSARTLYAMFRCESHTPELQCYIAVLAHSVYNAHQFARLDNRRPAADKTQLIDKNTRGHEHSFDYIIGQQVYLRANEQLAKGRLLEHQIHLSALQYVTAINRRLGASVRATARTTIRRHASLDFR